MRWTDEALANEEFEDDANVPDPEEKIRPHMNKSRRVIDMGKDVEKEDSKWLLRHRCAFSLDNLAFAIEGSIISPLMKILESAARSTDWKEREAAVLALGAIADPCWQDIDQYASQTTPFLIQELSDSEVSQQA